MFRGQSLAKPQAKSVLGALFVAALAMFGSQATPLLGYVFALLAMVMIIVVSLMDSAWPRQSRKENSLVFSLFWGLMIGIVLPGLVSTFMEGGVAGLYELYRSEP